MFDSGYLLLRQRLEKAVKVHPRLKSQPAGGLGSHLSLRSYGGGVGQLVNLAMRKNTCFGHGAFPRYRVTRGKLVGISKALPSHL